MDFKKIEIIIRFFFKNSDQSKKYSQGHVMDYNNFGLWRRLFDLIYDFI